MLLNTLRKEHLNKILDKINNLLYSFLVIKSLFKVAATRCDLGMLLDLFPKIFLLRCCLIKQCKLNLFLQQT